METVFHDSQDRILLVIKEDGQFAFSRYPDLLESEKEMMIEIYEKLSGNNKEKFVQFINYKEDSVLFCS